MTDPSAPLAFAAGVVSFLSPCVLPLVPGYLSWMSGVAASGEGPTTRRVLGPSLAFVGGFSAIFVALGATATLLGSLLREHQTMLTRVGGVLIILFGLIFMGALKIPWLYREARFHVAPEAGLWGSALLGATFAFGWSPCIGATMGAVLTLAAARSTVAQGALLLSIYSLGLGLPFILSALGVSRLKGAMAWMRRHVRAVNMAGGIMLVAIGLLLVTGRMFEISIWMQRALTNLDLEFWSF